MVNELKNVSIAWDLLTRKWWHFEGENVKKRGLTNSNPILNQSIVYLSCYGLEQSTITIDSFTAFSYK